MTINELKELLDTFLERWPISEIETLTLDKYVGIRDKDTFCQWVETKTRLLGSIKGLTSIKFGIYQREDPTKQPKLYKNDDKYSWLKAYGNNRDSAFDNVKKDILKIIKYAEIGDFEKIDTILLPDLFKWKIAFLYSNERLVPIFKREVLHRIASHFNTKEAKDLKISQIQRLMISEKPTHLNVFQFMWRLMDQFRGAEKNEKSNILADKGTKRLTRKAAVSRNTNPHVRTIHRSFLVEQKHNKVQEALKAILIEQYGENNVILEENFVDIKVLQSNYISFYEVKSSSYASECIKDALGQILLYSLNDYDERKKRHFVVGQYPPTENDQKYIDFLKENLAVDFDYIHVNIK